MTDKKAILVTGSEGFIGKNLMRHIFTFRDKYHVYGFDFKRDVQDEDIRTHINHGPEPRKFDYVIHLAADVSVVNSMTSPRWDLATNIDGTLNMVLQYPEAKFIYISTSCFYGEGENHTEESLPNPQSAYAISKLAGEYYVRVFAQDWVILRLGNVIGDGERGEPNVYQAFEKQNPLVIYGDGSQTRDFIDVKDVCRAIEKSLSFNHEIFNIGSGKPKSVLEVANEFNKPKVFFPPRRGEVHKFGLDVSKARKAGLLDG